MRKTACLCLPQPSAEHSARIEPRMSRPVRGASRLGEKNPCLCMYHMRVSIGSVLGRGDRVSSVDIQGSIMVMNESPAPPRVRNMKETCACGYDRSGLPDMQICPECGQLAVRGNFRKAVDGPGGGLATAAFILSLVCLGLGILDLGVVMYAIYVVTTYWDPQIGLVFIYPVLGFMFVVLPAFLLALLFSIIGMASTAKQNAPGMKRSLIALGLTFLGALLPVVPFLLFMALSG